MSLSEVIRTSVRLPQHDKALEAEKVAFLRHQIGIGVADATGGGFPASW